MTLNNSTELLRGFEPLGSGYKPQGAAIWKKWTSCQELLAHLGTLIQNIAEGARAHVVPLTLFADRSAVAAI